ncbi:MAG: PepSY domain-containing protein [Pseudobdellovibrionaceae bacterium]|nr:PepSY domain-containing protein [Pseudobdellovibrionaceae bacterium]
MLLKSKNFNKLHRLHRWLGLILSIHILLLALTGIVLVFRDELAPTQTPVPLTGQLVSLQSLVDKSLAQYPQDRVLAIGLDHHDPHKTSLRLGPDGSPKFRGARRLHFDRRNGELYKDSQQDTGFVQTLLILHRELFLGTPAKLYVGILGLIYAFILITGLVLYGPMMKRQRFGSLRTHLNPRHWWADLHKNFGALTFGWSLVVGLSGFMLGWGGPIIKFYQGYALQDLTAEFSGPQENRSFVPVDQALQAAEKAKPDGQFSFVAFPTSEFSTAHHYIFVMDGTTPLTEKLSDLVVVNAYDGQLERVLIQPWYLQLLLLAEPLHFGDYGGLPMKILWVIFGLASMVLPVSGLRVFLQKFWKQQEQKRSLAFHPSKGSASQHPYAWPLVVMGLSWMGLVYALLVEGPRDAWANLCLAAALIIPVWLFRKHKRTVASDS